MAGRKNFRKRRESTSSEEGGDERDEAAEESQLSHKEKIEELKFIQKQRERKHGIDVYSLAIGEQESTRASLAQDQIEVSSFMDKMK